MPDNLVTLREGPGTAVAFIHPASGLATAFRRLVPHLGGRGGVFASENLEAGPEQRCSIGALAEDYWDQLRGHLDGAVVLAGWSFGGPVALRMAALAEAAGHDVRRVVLIDSGTPEMLATRPDTSAERVAGLFELEPAVVAHCDPAGGLEPVLEAVAAQLRGLHGGQVEPADLRPFVDVYLWHLRAGRRPWHPGGVATPVLLVRARDERGWAQAPDDLGWSTVLGASPELEWTPGTHYDLMSARHAPFLADLVNPLLTDGAIVELARD